MSGKIIPMTGRDERARKEFLDGVEVKEVFGEEVPRVRTELVIKPTGLPPEAWDLVPIASLK